MRSGWPRLEHLAGAAAALLIGSAALAAVDVNRADQATLESIKGVGTALSANILDERAKAPFRNWADLLARVKGMGSASAARLSDAGLTVNGETYQPPAGTRAP
jgi:competence protein ComEA